MGAEHKRLRHGDRRGQFGRSASNNGERAGNVWSDGWSGPDRLAVESQLRSSYGFLVDTTEGREVGIVDEVVVDEAGHVVRLEVCGGWFGRRRRVVKAGDVVELFPLERRLIVLRSVVDDQSS